MCIGHDGKEVIYSDACDAHFEHVQERLVD